MTQTQTRERPILFSGPMVRAILDGRKTQTRRVIKPQPDFSESPYWEFGDGHSGTCWYCGEDEYRDEGSVSYRCPYGVPGDRLYVREAFRTWCLIHDGGACELAAQCTCNQVDAYRADMKEPDNFNWTPSIHMPKWAARIWLEVIQVRVERVQEISIHDVLAEGTEIGALEPVDADGAPLPPEPCPGATIQNFEALWDDINAKRGYSWDSNPWVWTVEFRKVKPEE